jgi:hypothetical protein
VLASDFINGDGGVRTTLLDAAKRTWPDAELLEYLLEAIRATCSAKTDTYTVRAAIPLVYGTRQELPAGGIAIFDAYENDASGSMVTLADRELIDHQNRFWPTATHEIDVQHWSADPRDPRRFTVTPPNNGYGAMWALYGAVPDDIIISDEIPLEDTYLPALNLYVQAKAMAKNTQRQNVGKAESLMAQWRQALGLEANAKAAVAPSIGRSTAGA